jgi:hypothetical protein
MGQVVIQFEGICVNFKQSDFPFLPAAHRIVLINASEITDVWGNTIEKHHAGFATNLGANTQIFPLPGATVKIVNPITTGLQTGVTYIEEPPEEPGQPGPYSDIPSLTALTPDPPLSPVSLAVLIGNNPGLVKCYFDVDYGTIGSTISQFNALMTVVTILTDGDPQYQVTLFPTALSSTAAEDPEPELATKMFFWNEEDDPFKASDDDFMLSYLVVSPPPVDPPGLPESTGAGSSPNRKASVMAANPETVGLMDGFTDLGCSNSTYP